MKLGCRNLSSHMCTSGWGSLPSERIVLGLGLEEEPQVHWSPKSLEILNVYVALYTNTKISTYAHMNVYENCLTVLSGLALNSLPSLKYAAPKQPDLLGGWKMLGSLT